MEIPALLDRLLPAESLRGIAQVPLFWLARARTRRQLRALDGRALVDIGFDSKERDRECALWPWQGRDPSA